MALGTLRLKTIELEGEISYLTKASVPIGFTYIQFPGKSEPSVLYYGVWSDISGDYIDYIVLSEKIWERVEA